MLTLLDHFTLKIARSAEEIDFLQHLRWAVYCREFGYEREEDCPGEREKDLFDPRSVHLYMQHRSTGHIAGVVRIIPANNFPADMRLPFEAAYQASGNSFDADSDVSRDRIIEISRMAVATEFRRRQGERGSPIGLGVMNELASSARYFPLLPLSLYLSVAAHVELSGQHDTYGYAMMEPRLIRLLHRYGIHFAQVAPTIEYHGERAAYRITLDDVFKNLKEDLRELYTGLRNILENEPS
ncbi:PEP-CTERM/exosortase system-associated acyltransferase [Acidihalobacter ferrooxydans]|uniref:GNAT family N-acetyltransferase n=1 Tax=Acidihalobacter ferrooxydans TaxID=1765967 RepID=A0A1P8UGM6_9GAMM|nr:PEP-CTERM/exosortase system-associated acyltransferase [Acidihalobacter ferrooxydans]APZ42975.1 hypothetical protein BW247_07605 [Acidihalobacter ferrooxydans]